MNLIWKLELNLKIIIQVEEAKSKNQVQTNKKIMREKFIDVVKKIEIVLLDEDYIFVLHWTIS